MYFVLAKDTREKTQISKPDISGGHNKLIRCDFCTATFTRQNNLTRHKKIHTVNLQVRPYCFVLDV